MENKKICPLLLPAYKKDQAQGTQTALTTECREEKCAWWCPPIRQDDKEVIIAGDCTIARLGKKAAIDTLKKFQIIQ